MLANSLVPPDKLMALAPWAYAWSMPVNSWLKPLLLASTRTIRQLAHSAETIWVSMAAWKAHCSLKLG